MGGQWQWMGEVPVVMEDDRVGQDREHCIVTLEGVEQERKGETR